MASCALAQTSYVFCIMCMVCVRIDSVLVVILDAAGCMVSGDWQSSGLRTQWCRQVYLAEVSQLQLDVRLTSSVILSS